MLVDARHKPTANDVTMASYFLQTGKPFVVVANKLDKLKKSEIEPNLACIRETLACRRMSSSFRFPPKRATGGTYCSRSFSPPQENKVSKR